MTTETTDTLHARATALCDGTVAAHRRYAIAWLHEARQARGLAREEAISRLREQAWLARYTRRPADERPAWDRLADRLDRVCDRLAALARPEREQEIAQRIDGWLESPRSTGAEHVAAYASAMRTVHS